MQTFGLFSHYLLVRDMLWPFSYADSHDIDCVFTLRFLDSYPKWLLSLLSLLPSVSLLLAKAQFLRGTSDFKQF